MTSPLNPFTMLPSRSLAMASTSSDASLENTQQPDPMPAQPRYLTSKRGIDGRYVSSGNRPDVSVARQWEKNKRYRVKVRNQQDGFFRVYVRVFFVLAREEISFRFPLVAAHSFRFLNAYSRRSSFWPGTIIPLCFREFIDSNEGMLVRPIELTRISVRNSGVPGGRSSRIKI